MKPVMYLIANSSVKMSKGKFGAQAAHAGVEAYRLSAMRDNDHDMNLLAEWFVGGHYTKIVLMADDLHVAERYLRDRGFDTTLIIDEGRTEFDGVLTPTFLGCAIVDKDDEHTAATFGTFKLYREPKPVPTETRGPRRTQALLDLINGRR